MNHSLNSLSFSALLSAITLYFFELYMAYTGRHSYFLCFILFVFRRSPARLAVKKYAHAKREEDLSLIHILPLVLLLTGSSGSGGVSFLPASPDTSSASVPEGNP